MQRTAVTRDLFVTEISPASAAALPTVVGNTRAIQPSARASFAIVDASGRALASVALAEPEDVAAHTGLGRAQADRIAWLADVRRVAGPVGERAVALALYAAGQHARIHGRTQVAIDPTDDGSGLARLLALAPSSGTTTHVGRLDVALARSFAAVQSEADPIAPDFLVSTIETRLRGYFERMWQGRWFRAVDDGTLGRAQYVYTLSNMHQFVRYTTRILGRCVAAADDTELRQHFVRHLQGEVNHELIIERDLAALGEDLDHVLRTMAPNAATRQFMAAQESAIAFHRDPVLLLAAPLAAEGISGHLDGRFMAALHRNAARWGVVEPARVTRFFASHIEYDGGDDGHWSSTMAILAAYLRDEAALARFHSMLEVTTEAMLRCYDSWIDELPL